MRILGILLVVLGTLAGGCMVPYPLCGQVAFSPDGETIAYIRGTSLVMLLPKLPVAHKSIEVRWRPVASAWGERRRHLDSEGMFPGSAGISVEGVRLKFSPDGKHMAILTPNHLSVIEIASGKLRRIEGRDVIGGFAWISSFAWLDNDRIAIEEWSIAGERGIDLIYGVKKDGKKDGKKRPELFGLSGTRAFRVHHIARATETDRIVYSAKQKWVAIADLVRSFFDKRAYWSPGGRFVIFAGLDPAPGLWCLDISADSRPVKLASVELHRMQVAWRADETAALCAFGAYTGGKRGDTVRYTGGSKVLFLQFDGRKGQPSVVDLTAKFKELDVGGYPHIEPLWTADGKYVLAGRVRCEYLVQPSPWRALKIEELLAGAGPTGLQAAHCRQVAHLPRPGLLLATSGEDFFAVDYERKKAVRLFNAKHLYGPWYFSPDGRTAATLDVLRGLVVRKTNLDELSGL